MLAALALLVACGGGEVGEDQVIAPPPASAPTTLRGELIWGHETRSFRECGSEEALWFVDESGGDVARIYQRLASEPYQGLFFEVRGTSGPAPESGFGEDYAASLVIHQVRRAEFEGWGCREDLSETEVRAFGVEPFWSLAVRASGLSLTRPEPEASVEWPTRVASFDEGEIRYSATGEPGEVEVLLIESRCIDAMSGAHFSWKAEVRVGGDTLLGCAVTGDAMERD